MLRQLTQVHGFGCREFRETLMCVAEVALSVTC